MNSTTRSVAVGAGVAVLMLMVGTATYTMTRNDGPSTAASSEVDSGEGNTGLPEGEVSSSSSTVAPIAVEATTTTTTTEVPEREFAELFEDLRPAVASVTAVACDTTRQGTAFLVSDDIVYTSASVVVEAAEVAVTIGETSIEAVVLGQDPERNIAALRLSEPVTDITPLTLSKTSARVGSEVGAIVHPIALPVSLMVGRLVSVDASFSPALLRTNADAELGSSGGPMIDRRGHVVGIVSLGVDDDGNLTTPLSAVDAVDVQEQLAGWVAEPTARAGAFCVGNVDLSEIDAVAGDLIAADTDHPQIAALQRTYAVYSQSINSSRAENAYDVLGPAITTTGDREAWADAQRTSKLWDWRIRSVENVDNSTLSVRSVFTSTQDAEFGFDGSSTCTRWDITHDLVSGTFRGESYWLINRSRATEGSGPVDCDEWVPELVAREELVAEVPGQLRRIDRLAGGTVHNWDFGLGAFGEDEDVTPIPFTLTVTVDEVTGFDPVIEVRSQSGSLLAANDDAEEGSVNSEVTITVTTGESLSVRVRDSSNRAGGEYAITFDSAEG